MVSSSTTNGSSQGRSVTVSSNAQGQPVVCVFCGSSEGTSPVHLEAARSLARTFHKYGIKLVYGGGTTGLMGELAKTLVSLSGPDAVHGIIPQPLLRFERNFVENGATIDPKDVIDEKTYGRTSVVEDMHTRKHNFMVEVVKGGPGSGFVALTGGWGTMEELMEVVTWNQLGIHNCPIIAYSVGGFWDPILQWAKSAVGEGFITESNQSILGSATTSEEVVEKLQNYRPSEGRLNLNWKQK